MTKNDKQLKNKKNRLSADVRAELHDWYVKQADELGVTPTCIVKMALYSYMKSQSGTSSKPITK